MGYDILEVAVEDKDLVDWVKLKRLVDDAGLKVTISGAFGSDFWRAIKRTCCGCMYLASVG